MSEFSESQRDPLFINADCIVKKGEQREGVNAKKSLISPHPLPPALRLHRSFTLRSNLTPSSSN